MKRIILLLAVSALLVLVLAVPALADKGGESNGGNSGSAELCRNITDPPVTPSGPCTSFFARA